MKLRLFFALLLASIISFTVNAQGWEPLGPVNPAVNNLCHDMTIDTDNDLLIVGGRFTQIGGNFYNYIARWDGTNWSALPNLGPGGRAEEIEYFDSCVWVRGDFTSAGGTLFVPQNWARHTPNGWDIPQLLPFGAPGHFDVIDSMICLMGVFNSNLIGVDSTTTLIYSPFAGATNNGGVITIYKYQNTLYIGGGFTTIDSNPNANHFVFMDSNGDAQPVSGYGANDPVYEMIEYNGDLIVAGGFTVIGGDSIPNIARYDGTNWHSLGEGPNGYVTDLAVHDGWLYAAGPFDTIGGEAIRAVAKWNGQYWKRVAHSDITLLFGEVNDLKVFQGDLYMCGDFYWVDYTNIDNIARMVDAVPIAESLISDTMICVGDTFLFEDRSWGPADSILFEFGGGIPATSTQLEQNVTWNVPGIHTVTHYAYNQLGVDTTSYTIYVGGMSAEAGNDTLVCDGESVPLNASGGALYNWTPSTGLSDPAIVNPVATPSTSTTYWVEVVDSLGCVSNDSVVVTVSPPISANFSFDNAVVSWSNAVVNFQDLSSGSTSWEWHFGDGQTSTDQNPSHTYQVADTFDVTLIVWNDDGCSDTFFIQDAVIVIDDSNVDELNDEVEFKLSPNPADDRISVSWNSNVLTATTVEIVDVRGRVAFSEQLQSGVQFLGVDCRDWNSGTYFVKFVTGEGVLSTLTVVVAH